MSTLTADLSDIIGDDLERSRSFRGLSPTRPLPAPGADEAEAAMVERIARIEAEANAAIAAKERE